MKLAVITIAALALSLPLSLSLPPQPPWPCGGTEFIVCPSLHSHPHLHP